MGHAQEDATTGDTLMDLFLVTSGLLNQYGVYHQSERFIQLCDTVQSIHKHMPNNHVVVIDASPETIQPYQQAWLQQYGCNFVQLILEPNDLSTTTDDPNQFRPKTLGELKIWKFFLTQYLRMPNKYRRIHKLSGRYQINDKYANHKHDDINVIISKRRSWTNPLESTQEKVYPTRLWSFHSNLTPEITDVWRWIETHTNAYLSQNMIRPLEVSLYHALQQHKIPCEAVFPIGCLGRYGQDGNGVVE